MGKSKPKIEVTKYFLSEHFGICQAEPDVLLDVQIKEKSILPSAPTSQATLSINKPDLFGGLKKEGGAEGNLTYLPGSNSQLLPDVLAQKLGRSGGSDAPGYRGIASLFFYGSGGRGFYWTANSPFIPGIWAKVQRILKRSDGSEQWYKAKAPIVAGGIDEAELISSTNIDMDAVSDTFTTVSGLWSGARAGLRFSCLPTDFIRVKARIGGTYVAWSPWGSPPAAGGNSGSSFRFSLATSSSTREFYVDDAENIDGYEAARDLFLAEYPDGITFTGSSEYRMGFIDSPINDNSGGLSLTVEILRGDVLDMNPAHIIRECLTDRNFGMGTPTSALDDVSFTAAADTLFDEGFGLSMIWTRQASIESFVQEVLDHIQGVIYVDPSTGLLTLDLIRDDYDVETLPVIDPENGDLTNFSRKLWGDIVNEIIVTWTNPLNEQEETITVQDNASIAIQGGIVSDSRNYYGVRNAQLAQDLAYRDLRSAGQPLASCEAEVDRTQYALRPGSVIKLTWPEYGLDELVMRVQSVDYGKPGDPAIKLNLIEDVYGLDIGNYDTAPGSSWVDPSAAPTDMDPVEIITLPYFLAANAGIFASEPVYPEVLSGILATTDNSDAFEYELWDEVTLSNGDTEQQALSTNNVLGSATLTSALDPEASSALVSFENKIGNTVPTLAGLVIIGDGTEATDEIALIDADNGDDTYTLQRGVLDTVPREWPAGTRVWFIDESTVYEDPLVRSAAEVVDYKMLPRTSLGLLDLADATEQSATLTERPWLPNRPANVVVYGEAFSTEGNPIDATLAGSTITATWANRNRLEEDSQVLAWADANVTPETGQTTTIEIRSTEGTLITEHTGLTGTSFDIPIASFGSEQIAEVRVFAERSDADGDFVSLQYFSHWLLLDYITFDSSAITFDNGNLTMDQGI